MGDAQWDQIPSQESIYDCIIIVSVKTSLMPNVLDSVNESDRKNRMIMPKVPCYA